MICDNLANNAFSEWAHAWNFTPKSDFLADYGGFA